jgi:hypothetical protein
MKNGNQGGKDFKVTSDKIMMGIDTRAEEEHFVLIVDRIEYHLFPTDAIKLRNLITSWANAKRYRDGNRIQSTVDNNQSRK